MVIFISRCLSWQILSSKKFIKPVAEPTGWFPTIPPRCRSHFLKALQIAESPDENRVWHHRGPHRIPSFQRKVKHHVTEILHDRRNERSDGGTASPIPRRAAGTIGLRCRLLLQSFRHVQLDLAIARLEILDRRGQVQAQALGGIV